MKKAGKSAPQFTSGTYRDASLLFSRRRTVARTPCHARLRIWIDAASSTDGVEYYSPLTAGTYRPGPPGSGLFRHRCEDLGHHLCGTSSLWDIIFDSCSV